MAHGDPRLQRCRAVIADRDLGGLSRWLMDARSSGLPSVGALAHGMDGDRAAVIAARTLPWSSGPVEGPIGRGKLIKRQGYGHAKLDLLRRRVLGA